MAFAARHNLISDFEAQHPMRFLAVHARRIYPQLTTGNTYK